MTAFLNTVCDMLFARSKWQRFTFFSVFSNSSFFCPTLSCTCAFVMAHFKIVYFSALTVFQCCLIYQTKNIRNFLGREYKRNFINIKVLFSFFERNNHDRWYGIQGIQDILPKDHGILPKQTISLHIF